MLVKSIRDLVAKYNYDGIDLDFEKFYAKGETRAKPEIWKESAKFKEAVDKNQAEMAKVVAAAKTGNLDALKAAVGPAGSSCKACHDNFRKD